jgi:hypothetical protein
MKAPIIYTGLSLAWEPTVTHGVVERMSTSPHVTREDTYGAGYRRNPRVTPARVAYRYPGEGQAWRFSCTGCGIRDYQAGRT